MLRNLVLVAVAYFIGGYIGTSLAVPPGYATIVWPASGVALCAVLARGIGMWPGIWLGSFVLNVMAGMDAQPGAALDWQVLAIAAVLGAGASLQAVGGLAMARRYPDGIELSDYRRLARAVLMVIFLPCIIAPTIGVATLVAAGAASVEQIGSNWLTWYFGDVFGVVLVLPILLLSSLSPVSVQWRGRSLQGASSYAAICLVGTLLVTFYAWHFISEREYANAQSDFETMASDTDEEIRHRLQIYQRGIESGAAFAAINRNVSAADWRDYVDHLDLERSYPGMRGFGLFEAVSDDDLPAFRDRFAREFGDRFEVHPDVEREQHYIIHRIEPIARNAAALGLNLAFEEGRREAIANSLTRDQPILTRPIVLVQDERQSAGFLLMKPVRDGDGAVTGQWAYAPLVAAELFSDLTPRQGDEFHLQVYHGRSADPDALLYDTGGEDTASPYELQRTIELAGQPVTLRWTSLPAFESRHNSSAPLIALGSGLAITLLLAILLITFMRREGEVGRKVKQATAELAERNHLMQMAEATAHIGHWHLNIADNRIRWSDEVYRLHGLPLGQTPELGAAIEFFHPDDRALVEQSLNTAIAEGESYEFNARLLTADGKLRHVEVRGQVDTDEEGETSAVLGVIIDRTEETLMRQQLTQSIEEARAADRAKSSFLANMSHEIRTPMNGVIGFTELALADETDPEQKRRLQMIADSGNAMLRLLNDLLDFAKIEAKQMAIVSEPADLRHTLRSCQRLMEPVAKSQGLALELDIDPALPALVLVDKMRLRQIVLNLVGNALKFTETGSVTLVARVLDDETDDGARLAVSVRDTGIGIPANRLESIFDKFTQADDTTARRYGGTGLGLPISAELAELMGGELEAESEPGKGSVFTLTLPLLEATEAVTADDVIAPAPQALPQRQLHILVAEDNPVNQQLTTAMVTKIGHSCDLAQDGVEAVAAVNEAIAAGRPYDMVLMDMQMPNMDGLQASRAIRSAGIDAAALPIVAVTANAYADDLQRCAEAGMQAHLAKPLRISQLSDAISEWANAASPTEPEADGTPIDPIAEEEAPAPADVIEEVTDPRLRAMFDERLEAARLAIGGVIEAGRMTEEQREEIAGILHQVAGVAAFFAEEDLGELCRRSEKDLRENRGDEINMEIINIVYKRILSK